MKKYKKGDRVRMYSALYGEISAIVVYVGAPYLDLVGDDGVEYIAHRKQCRKLVPRKRCGAV